MQSVPAFLTAEAFFGNYGWALKFPLGAEIAFIPMMRRHKNVVSLQFELMNICHKGNTYKQLSQ